MLIEVNLENIQLDEIGMLREVHVERCEVVAVYIYYLQHVFLWMATGRIIVRFVPQNLLKRL